MQVTVEEFSHPRLWRVRVDGMHAGFMPRHGDGIQPGSKLLLHLRYPPDELAEIEKQISSHFAKDIGAVQPAEIPEDMLNPKDDEGDVLDDLE